MKIGFTEPHLKVYGGIRRVIELSNRLTTMGHQVTIYHPEGTPCRWMRCIAATKTDRQLLNETHDVLIFNDAAATDYELARLADARLKVFYVLELFDLEVVQAGGLPLFYPWHKRELFIRKSVRHADLVLANATWEKIWLQENLGIPCELLIGGVNREMFHPVEVERSPDRYRILCSGDPRPRRGTRTVLEAIAIARRSEPRIELDTYHGKGIPQERMAEVYASADLFVEASWQAGWNNPVIEAMACKTPVVCTEIGGVADFAFHEQTALLVPPRDPHAMARAIARLIEDRDLADRLRENAFRQVSGFDWEESAKRLETLLREALRRRGSARASRGLDWREMVLVKTLRRAEKTWRAIRPLLQR